MCVLENGQWNLWDKMFTIREQINSKVVSVHSSLIEIGETQQKKIVFNLEITFGGLGKTFSWG